MSEAPPIGIDLGTTYRYMRLFIGNIILSFPVSHRARVAVMPETIGLLYHRCVCCETW